MGVTRIDFNEAAARFYIHIATSAGGPDENLVKDVPYDRTVEFLPLEAGTRLAKNENSSWWGEPEVYWIPERGEAIAFLHGSFWDHGGAGGSGNWETMSGPYSLDQSTTLVPPHQPLVTAAVESSLLLQIAEIYDEILRDLARRAITLHQLEPRQFEQFIAGLFTRHGFLVTLTKQTKDGGYDVVAVKQEALGTDLRIIIECKRNRPDRPVGISVVRELWGVITNPKTHYDRGVIATTSRLTSDARLELKTSYWRLQELDHEAIMAAAGFLKRTDGLWTRG